MNSIKRIQYTYYLILSLFWLTTSLPMALFILLEQARGLNLFQVGSLMGIYALTVVLLEVPTGGLADAIGRKKVALMAYSCMIFSGLTMLFAFSFQAFLLSAILSGVGRALSSGALDAWFVDSLQAVDPTVDLQPALAKAGTFTLLSLGVGTLGGSLIPYLFTTLPADGTAVFTPFAMPVVFSIALNIILILATSQLIQEDLSVTNTNDWKQGFYKVPNIIRVGFTLTWRNPTILLLLGATLSAGLATISLESFWQPYFAHLLDDVTGNSLFFGVVMGGNFLVGMLGNFIATPISRWLNKRYGLVCAIFQGFWGLSIIALALQTTPALALVFFWVSYMNMGVINSPHATLLNQEIPTEQRSAMLSIASLATYLGAMIGGIGLGYVAENTSISTAWIIGGVALMVSLSLYWRVDVLQTKPKTKNQPLEARI